MSSSTAAAAAAVAPVADVLEERLIDAEYKIWKKNTPYLYDFVMTHSLEWPSLTCQWLPNVQKGSSSSSSNNKQGGGGGGGPQLDEHSLLLGTHTTGEQNYLMVAKVQIPANDVVIDHRTSSAASATGKPPAAATAKNSNNLKDTTNTKLTASYNEDKKELGGYTNSGNTGVAGKMEISMRVKHEGEVNRARYMPQNPFIVASRGPNPQVYIWDLSKHPSVPPDDAPFAPQGVCLGHEKEGYGLVWSPHKAGQLLSGSEDTTLCLWDVETAIGGGGARSASGTQLQPLSKFTGHTDVVEDVDWHPRDPHMVGSASDDGSVRLWDVRCAATDKKQVHLIEKAHTDDVNCLAFNPVNEFVLATGSADSTVRVWDMRNLGGGPTLTLKDHKDQVYHLAWASFNESVLAGCSADRRVAVWDLSRVGQEQSEEDAEDGPPELLFLRGGHTGKVSGCSWNNNDRWKWRLSAKIMSCRSGTWPKKYTLPNKKKKCLLERGRTISWGMTNSSRALNKHTDSIQ